MQPVRAQQRMQLSKYGIGSSPLERMAILAIESTNRGSCGLGGRDVSVQAEMAEEAESLDASTKAEVAGAVGKVMDKAAILKMPGAGISGDYNFFDPLGLSTDISEGKLLFFREAEIKHGRVCMLASLGIVVGEKYHSFFGGSIDGLAATLGPFQSLTLTQTNLKIFWLVIVISCGAAEYATGILGPVKYANDPKFGEMKPGHVPGDFGWDPLGLKKGFVEKGTYEEIQTKELNNGRLAMIAVAGMIGQELATGNKIF